MKIIVIGDSILSLENVRRVNRSESHNKKEPHDIRIDYCDGASEWVHIDYNEKERFNEYFFTIKTILAGD